MAFPDYVTGLAGWEKQTTSGKKHPLGTKMTIRDRTFRYVENAGTEIGEALLCSGQAGVTTQDETLAVATTAAAGATSVSITIGGTNALEKNEYQDGYIFNNTAAGTAALQYRVASHALAAASATVTIYLDEPDGLVNAWTAGTDVVGLIGSPWKDIVVSPTTVTGWAVGVTCNTLPASHYGWVQTGGPGLAYLDCGSGTAVGSALMAGTNHVGQMELLTYENEDYQALATVGSLAGVDNAYNPVWLTIE
jgi:hypothetical protein